jgi:hypothetical protein
MSGDLLLIAMGIFPVWVVADELRDYPFMLSPSHLAGWLWFAPVCISVLLWAVGSVLVFGYDLGNYVRHRYARTQAKPLVQGLSSILHSSSSKGAFLDSDRADRRSAVTFR